MLPDAFDPVYDEKSCWLLEIVVWNLTGTKNAAVFAIWVWDGPCTNDERSWTRKGNIWWEDGGEESNRRR